MKILLPVVNLILVLLLVPGCPDSSEREPLLVMGPFLQQSGENEITVIWETARPSAGSLVWGRPGELNHSVSEQTGGKIHRLTMTGLEPATSYAYKLGYDGVWIDSAGVATLPSGPDARWRMAIYGDTQGRPQVHAAVVRRIMESAPDVVMHLGDFTNDGRDHELWIREFFEPAAPLGRNVPFIPVIGNHEHDADLFYRYFGLDTTGSGHAWYGLDLGEAHITLLNSDSRYAGWDENSEQARWLVGDLGEHEDARWKIAAFHHPLFSSRNSRPTAPQRWLWHQLLEALGVDIAFHGHEHNYFRSVEIGTFISPERRRSLPYVIVGSGGGETKNLDHQDYTNQAREQCGFVTVDFSVERLVCRALDSSGVVTDSFTVERDRQPEATEFASFSAEMLRRQIVESIYQSEPLEVAGGKLEGTVKLEFPTFFNIPLAAKIEWDMPAGWRVHNTKYDSLIIPNDIISFEFCVSARPETYDLGPAAKLKLTLPEGGKAFTNDLIVFHPFKIRRSDPLTANLLAAPPVIDGDLGKAEWNGTKLLDNFFRTTRELPSGNYLRSTAVRLGHFRNTLYLAGQFLGQPNPSRNIQREKDSHQILGDEMFTVSLAGKEFIAMIVVTSASSVLDAVAGNPESDLFFDYAVSTTDTSWSVEVALPLNQFPGGAPDRINLYRSEYNCLLADEWNPSYKPMFRRYSVTPAYGISFQNPSCLVKLIYQK